ncbi:adenine glycosylase [Bifidobacterium moukalabense DSM 27321]|uniref:Adenine DNA glycosylase n=2 Tax=Bifidobacterium moukalabense TaxID=1333651 RepID=W4N9Z9_9BIFI|nr:adenine glycosylase [Bifidobacterium moukalabense DSM 27321]
MNDTNTSAEAVPSMSGGGCGPKGRTILRDSSERTPGREYGADAEHSDDAGVVAGSLAEWWRESARDLPWRFGRTTPWGVLVSEVMSQQTQMSRVVPYWQAWMERWPDAAALADAPKADVITAWGRLGYPRRALRLQECARVVANDYHDDLPHTYDELTALPGIGDYTASAVMSFAYGERIAVIDTNIRRVLSRVFLGTESRGGAASPAERALANKVLPEDPVAGCRGFDRPSVMWNQSVMELGAVICTAKSPLCEQCPVSAECAFLANGRPGLGERRTRPRQRFQGTDRQVRGLVLNALRGLPEGRSAVGREDLERLWNDHIQLDRCIASLDDDGLIDMLPDGSVRLPG